MAPFTHTRVTRLLALLLASTKELGAGESGACTPRLCSTDLCLPDTIHADLRLDPSLAPHLAVRFQSSSWIHVRLLALGEPPSYGRPFTPIRGVCPTSGVPSPGVLAAARWATTQGLLV